MKTTNENNESLFQQTISPKTIGKQIEMDLDGFI